MRNIAFMLVVAPLVIGCVSVPTQSVSSQSVDAWKGKTVALDARPRAGLVMMTAGKAVFGAIGAVAGIEAGKELVKRDQIADPAPQVANELLQIAEKRYGVVPASLPPAAVDTTDVAQLAKAAQGADLLFDVQSLGEMVNYYPTNWSHYWVGSGLVLRVIDVHTGAVVGEAVCHQNSQHQANPPSKSELLANGGQLLKTTLALQWDDCRDELADKVLRANPMQSASAGYSGAQASQ